MSRDWKPGDVAAVTRSAWRGRAMFAGDRWIDEEGIPDKTEPWGDITEPRPLVVIDPEDREQIERLTKILGKSGAFTGFVRGNADLLKSALQSMNEPPRPVEPHGHGGVIEDADGHTHVRAPRDDGRPWVGSDGKWRPYDDIAVVRVLAEGWSE